MCGVGEERATADHMSDERVTDERRAELAGRLAAVRGRIAAACAAAGRDPDRVELMAVTKTVPAADVAALLDLGLTLFGENRAQEAGAKVAAVAALRPGADRVRWHFIGGLQRNKARAVAEWAHCVESVDSARLADALATATARACDDGRRDGPLPVLLQYSVDGDPSRGGVPADELLALADHVAGCSALRLEGLMAVAPLDAEPDAAFADVEVASERLRSAHPEAALISAGMSGDLEIAIRHASGVVRVGTALVGHRPLASQ